MTFCFMRARVLIISPAAWKKGGSCIIVLNKFRIKSTRRLISFKVPSLDGPIDDTAGLLDLIYFPDPAAPERAYPFKLTNPVPKRHCSEKPTRLCAPHLCPPCPLSTLLFDLTSLPPMPLSYLLITLLILLIEQCSRTLVG